MKKIIILIINIVLSISLYAQYRDTYWGETIQELTSTKEIYRGDTLANQIEYRENKIIIGTQTYFSYIFTKNKLTSIGYEINYTPEKLNQLKTKMNSGLYKIKETYETYTIGTKEIIQEAGLTNCQTLLINDDINTYLSGGRSMLGVAMAGKDKTSDTPAEIIILEYGYNTDVYIYANIIEDKIIVIYTQHEDDF